MKPPVLVSDRAMRCSVWMFGQAYIDRVMCVPGLTTSSKREVWPISMCSKAVRRPSRLAARRIFCVVSGRKVATVYMSCRVAIRRTGAPTARAAAMVSSAYAGSPAFDPKAPPTKAEMTSTALGASPKAATTPALAVVTDCEGIHSVSRSPCHSAVAAKSSIGLWCWKGVV